MKNKNLKKLVKALRSGKYRQGRRMLNFNNDRFCVLGVACEVAIENGVKVEKSLMRNGLGDTFMYYNDSNSQLPPDVTKYFQFENESGVLKNDKCLIILNDDNRLSFDEIADVIVESEK